MVWSGAAAHSAASCAAIAEPEALSFAPGTSTPAELALDHQRQADGVSLRARRRAGHGQAEAREQGRGTLAGRRRSGRKRAREVGRERRVEDQAAAGAVEVADQAERAARLVAGLDRGDDVLARAAGEQVRERRVTRPPSVARPVAARAPRVRAQGPRGAAASPRAVAAPRIRPKGRPKLEIAVESLEPGSDAGGMELFAHALAGALGGAGRAPGADVGRKHADPRERLLRARVVHRTAAVRRGAGRAGFTRTRC